MLLLSEKYPDARVRRWALSCLELLNNDELESLLSQLVSDARRKCVAIVCVLARISHQRPVGGQVQTLKCELYHDSALMRFILRRSMSDRRIGQRVYWLASVEMKADPRHATRLG